MEQYQPHIVTLTLTNIEILTLNRENDIASFSPRSKGGTRSGVGTREVIFLRTETTISSLMMKFGCRRMILPTGDIDTDLSPDLRGYAEWKREELTREAR